MHSKQMINLVKEKSVSGHSFFENIALDLGLSESTVAFIAINKPGMAQVGAISKAQKDSKTTFSTTGDNKTSQKTKN